jgi:hypothetical protein
MREFLFFILEHMKPAVFITIILSILIASGLLTFSFRDRPHSDTPPAITDIRTNYQKLFQSCESLDDTYRPGCQSSVRIMEKNGYSEVLVDGSGSTSCLPGMMMNTIRSPGAKSWCEIDNRPL